MMREAPESTKARLLREIVQRNVQDGRRPTLRPAASRRTSPLPLALAGVLMIVCLLYVSLPSRTAPVVAQAGSARSADGLTPAVSVPAGRLAIRPAAQEPLGPAPRRLAQAVLPLTVKRIVLDPGHGGQQLGAVSRSGVTEKAITLDIAERLQRLMKQSPYEVLLTRERDLGISLEERVAFANAQQADLFVSIHVNWIPSRGVRPLETYFVGPTDDPADLRLASAENRDAGYPLAAYRRLLEKVYIDTRRDESRALAQTIHGELYRSLSGLNPRLENRGVKMAPFAVLVGTEMPAILVEVSCLSNDQEVELLTSADYREQIAAALLRGIRAYSKGLDELGRKEG